VHGGVDADRCPSLVYRYLGVGWRGQWRSQERKKYSPTFTYRTYNGGMPDKAYDHLAGQSMGICETGRNCIAFSIQYTDFMIG